MQDLRCGTGRRRPNCISCLRVICTTPKCKHWYQSQAYAEHFGNCWASFLPSECCGHHSSRQKAFWFEHEHIVLMVCFGFRLSYETAAAAVILTITFSLILTLSLVLISLGSQHYKTWRMCNQITHSMSFYVDPAARKSSWEAHSPSGKIHTKLH